MILWDGCKMHIKLCFKDVQVAIQDKIVWDKLSNLYFLDSTIKKNYSPVVLVDYNWD